MNQNDNFFLLNIIIIIFNSRIYIILDDNIQNYMHQYYLFSIDHKNKRSIIKLFTKLSFDWVNISCDK